ncbi:MAG: glycosyltransferase [candidate division KSB1 bacterium]|nr:glycosyltransferase [candidate division KSB1 bacterium]
MTRRLVVVSYDFAPRLSPGTLRWLRLVRYLPDQGWLPAVVTSADSNGLQDVELLEQIPPAVSVTRVPTLGTYPRVVGAIDRLSGLRSRLMRREKTSPVSHHECRSSRGRAAGPGDYLVSHLFVPDHAVDWLPRALPAAQQILRQHQSRLLITTSPPHSVHLLGLAIKRAAPWRVRWIADFRDPWMDNATRKYAKARSPLLDRLEAGMERRVIMGADLILANTPRNRTRLLSRYPDLPEGKVVVLPNGYDPAGFPGSQPFPARNHRMTITFVGYFYQIFGEGFLDAVERALTLHPELNGGIQLRLIGQQADPIRARLHRLASRDPEMVALLGPLAHRQSLAELQAGDVLLCLNYPGEEGKACVPSKLYEYLAVGKPILLLSPPGDAWDLVRLAKAGECVHPSDGELLVETIWRLYGRWRDGSLAVSADRRVIRPFRSDEQARILAGHLENLDRRT